MHNEEHENLWAHSHVSVTHVPEWTIGCTERAVEHLGATAQVILVEVLFDGVFIQLTVHVLALLKLHALSVPTCSYQIQSCMSGYPPNATFLRQDTLAPLPPLG